MSKKVCFLLRDKDYVLDGLRSTLGLSVENNYSYAVVMKTEIDKFDEYNAENLDWIRDMEGEVFSTIPANVEKNGLVAISLEELGQKLREMDIIVPYGV
jgi:hypothetical protein